MPGVVAGRSRGWWRHQAGCSAAELVFTMISVFRSQFTGRSLRKPDSHAQHCSHCRYRQHTVSPQVILRLQYIHGVANILDLIASYRLKAKRTTVAGTNCMHPRRDGQAEWCTGLIRSLDFPRDFKSGNAAQWVSQDFALGAHDDPDSPLPPFSYPPFCVAMFGYCHSMSSRSSVCLWCECIVTRQLKLVSRSFHIKLA